MTYICEKFTISYQNLFYQKSGKLSSIKITDFCVMVHNTFLNGIKNKFILDSGSRVLVSKME